MLNAEAATERQGWANFSTSSRAGKWLADTVGYFSGLFDINLKSTDIAIIIYKFDKSFKYDHFFSNFNNETGSPLMTERNRVLNAQPFAYN